jgi:hypothetical protein
VTLSAYPGSRLSPRLAGLRGRRTGCSPPRNNGLATSAPRLGRRAPRGKSVCACESQIRLIALYRQCVERVCAEHGS